MKHNIYNILYISILVFSMQGCMSQVDSTSSHTESITTMNEKQTLIQEIDKMIESATDEINLSHWQEANDYLKKGLTALGDRYYDSRVQDDSGMKLVVADDFERKGFLERAARLRLKMLRERLDVFKGKP
jgi:sugar-specific transcriptional regulator TrmB